jgi:hypothetical protein
MAKAQKKTAATKGFTVAVTKKPTKIPKKKAPSSSSPMSKAPDLTHAEVSILGKMAGLEADSERYRVLEAALAFKSSWVILGEHLAGVLRTSAIKTWGYASFERFCADELFISGATAKKLVRSWSWLGDEAPEYLPPKTPHELAQRKESLPPGEMPDLNCISVLADAKKAYDEARVSEDAYLSLKRAAMDGETASALKRALSESIPEKNKPKQADDKVRHLRKALSAVVKVIDELREWDSGGDAVGEDLLVQAEVLRDAIAVRLPKE